MAPPDRRSRPVNSSTCFKVGGPFASFVYGLSASQINLILAPAIPILLANVALGAALFTLANLCDREALIRKCRKRASDSNERIDMLDLAENRREVLRIRKMNHCSLASMRQAERISNEVMPFPDLWQHKLLVIDEALSREMTKLEITTTQLRELERLSRTERMARFLQAPPGETFTPARMGLMIVGFGLFSMTVVLVVLGPFVILAQSYCQPKSVRQSHLTTALWILYSFCTCLPAALAWRKCFVSIWHWLHSICVECVEAPNTHTEHVANRVSGPQLKKLVTESTSSFSSSPSSSPISPTSKKSPVFFTTPTTPTHRCGSPTDLCGLERIEEEEHELAEIEVRRGSEQPREQPLEQPNLEIQIVREPHPGSPVSCHGHRL